MIKICVAGAAGRMGTAIIKEAYSVGIQTVGAIESSNSSAVGKTLRDLGISDQNTEILTGNQLDSALSNADVFISFTCPEADLINIPIVAEQGKRIVLGTTGFTPNQNRIITDTIYGKVPTVFSPNYSVGVNIFFKLIDILKAFPSNYDFSINEIHHTDKKDAPSGTANKLGELVSNVRNYTKTVTGREGMSSRQHNEMEITALRAGGVAGIHTLTVAGPHEMLRIEHTAFSRDALAQGAICAAIWLSNQRTPKIYNMADVLGLT
ncbi:MAG: 4-hydroxy-tetrahydrodipicolinate reductase [Candidatus Bathyarchaeota archaeon]|nr:4-hydroxy-tetrahydrodipicolinate reductase [Candidatus Termiticorpusculum sp.]MCL2868514.1 4-hydroxy-tetrahydrodipicolinate reductase [Candidatus Termiticorpusculum sp.]